MVIHKILENMATALTHSMSFFFWNAAGNTRTPIIMARAQGALGQVKKRNKVGQV